MKSSITPSAKRLVTSLRDIGYNFATATADLVDNSVSAGASKVDIDIQFAGRDSYALIADNGKGMSETELVEGLRFGTRREYVPEDLGRYGLGLKTASLSQGRRLTVVTRRALQYRRLYSRVLDLDHIARKDRWEVTGATGTRAFDLGARLLDNGPGTVIVIDKLDRVLPERRPNSGWARRRFQTLERRTAGYLGMVFHRLLEGPKGPKFAMTLCGKKIQPWNPFAPNEETVDLPPNRVEVETAGRLASVGFRGYVLPPRERFSSHSEFDRLGGPRRWNRQQGLYIYRAGRMVHSGGWCGLRAVDEHTKLARAAIDFDTGLDEFFRIDVAKMRVSLPAQIRKPLEQPIRELCHRAQTAYRSTLSGPAKVSAGGQRPNNGNGHYRDLALALHLAASEAGELGAWERIMSRLRQSEPDIAGSLGW